MNCSFIGLKKTFSDSELRLDNAFVRTNKLVFSNDKLEKKIRKRVLKASGSYKKKWSDYIFDSASQNDCLDDLYLEFVNPLVGFGVFASQPIEKFAFVGEYVGLVRRQKFFMQSDSDYVFRYSIAGKVSPWVIDADRSGNITRFFNHSYEPNLVCSSWFDNGLSHVGFFAKKGIKKGEQITFDYGARYWKRRPYPQTL